MKDTKQQAKILVVDDDENIRIVLQDILASEGYEIFQAGSGAEAVKLVRKAAPDVILLDIQMPDMDGLEVTRKLKKDPSSARIPVIIVTGLDDVQARVEALRLGADDFLVKPPHVAELHARVRSLVKVKAYNDHLLNYQKELEDQVAERTLQLNETLEELKKIHNRLKNSSLDTIYCLSRAAEYKDEDTATHLQRISNYSAIIGREIGMNENEVEVMLYASPMHDIGKIGVPDRILLKPEKLTKTEWKIMKQHTVFGGKILTVDSNGFIRVAQTIALTHHEKWDGTGYPKGLKGSEIPLVGRITAVADVFDALSSNRPYKKAFSVEKSFQIIREGYGSHFDPDVVDSFFKAKEEILSIKERFKDTHGSVFVQLVKE